CSVKRAEPSTDYTENQPEQVTGMGDRSSSSNLPAAYGLPASFCVNCGWLRPTACGFLPSKVLDCIIVATECHEKYKAHLRQHYGRLRGADAGPLSKVAAARASTSRQSL